MSASDQHKTTASYTFETPDYRGEMVRATVTARSPAIARYVFRRRMLGEHGIRVHPQMIYPVETPADVE